MLRTLLPIAGIIVAVYLVLATGPGEILAPLARIGWASCPSSGFACGWTRRPCGGWRTCCSASCANDRPVRLDPVLEILAHAVLVTEL